MPRRVGKAASRRSRRRHVQRTARPAAHAGLPVPPVGTPDAREAASLDPPPRRTPSPTASTGSTLTDRERAEYHYVERDLRNIGILTAVMTAMLLVAWFAFSALGLTS